MSVLPNEASPNDTPEPKPHKIDSSKPVAESKPEEQNGVDSGRSRKRNKRAKKKSKVADDPMKILEAVLEASSFKVANLSEEIEKMFNKEPEILSAIKDLSYKSKNSSQIKMSVLPHAFEGRVTVPTTAITNLRSIYEKPKPKSRRRPNRQKQLRSQFRAFRKKNMPAKVTAEPKVPQQLRKPDSSASGQAKLS